MRLDRAVLDGYRIRSVLAASILLGPALVYTAAPTISEIEGLIAHGKYNQALAALEAISRRSAHWHFLASKVFDGLEQPARAASEAETALDLDPAKEAHHLQLGQLLLTHNNADSAREVFFNALKQFPGSTLLGVGNGLALNRLQRFDEAELEFRQLLARQPKLGIALDGLVDACLQQVRYEEAATAAARFMAANADDYRGYYYAGLVADKSGSPPADVEKLLRMALDRNDRFAPARVHLGKALLRQGRPEEAALMLEGAVLLKPDYVLGHLHLARAYGRLGRRQDAERHVQLVQDLERIQQQPAPVLRRRNPSR